MKTELLSACVDANIYISGIAFGGNPLKILEHALNRKFLIITSHHIMTEVRKNLVNKLGLHSDHVDKLLNDMAEVSSFFVPSGKMKFITHVADNLVLETAIMGGADILVTGDKKHLLPLGNFQGIQIETPSKFLIRLES